MIQRAHTKRRALTLIDTILASVLAAGVSLPAIEMTRSAYERQRIANVREEMGIRGEALLDQVRIATGVPATFTSASFGALPAGISSDRTVAVFPGELVRERVSVAPHDLNRDLLTVTVTLDHQASGMTRRAASMQLVTQIARPW